MLSSDSDDQGGDDEGKDSDDSQNGQEEESRTMGEEETTYSTAATDFNVNGSLQVTASTSTFSSGQYLKRAREDDADLDEHDFGSVTSLLLEIDEPRHISKRLRS